MLLTRRVCRAAGSRPTTTKVAHGERTLLCSSELIFSTHQEIYTPSQALGNSAISALPTGFETFSGSWHKLTSVIRGPADPTGVLLPVTVATDKNYERFTPKTIHHTHPPPPRFFPHPPHSLFPLLHQSFHRRSQPAPTAAHAAASKL